MKTKFILLFLIISFSIHAIGSGASITNIIDVEKNPAVIATGYFTGLGFSQFSGDDYTDDYWDFSIFDKNIGYEFRNIDNSSSLYLVSKQSYNNIPHLTLYSGLQINWLKRDYEQATFDYSLLYRPQNFLSIGFKLCDIESFESLNLSLAIRPLWGKLNDKFTVSSDFNFEKNDVEDLDLVKPNIVLQTELFDGVNIDANYDMEDETIGIGFGINFNTSSVYSQATDYKNYENETKTSLFLSQKKYRFLFEKVPKKFYWYNSSTNIVDEKQEFKIGHINISIDNSISLINVMKKIELAKNDDKISGMVISVGNISTNFANFKDLEKSLLEFKNSGKKIVYYFDNISSINYCLAASTADKILIDPNGSIDLKGLAVNMPYFKDLLDTLGVSVTNFRSHKYKTAMNMFSENQITEAERETTQLLVDDLYDVMVEMINNGRKDILKKDVKDIIDEGPYYMTSVAKEIGLVDECIYRSDLKTYLKENYGVKSFTKKFEEEINYSWTDESYERIAIIYASGNIHMGTSTPGKTIGSETLSKAIRDAREDKNIKGIILRVNSGGGSAQASDIIAQEVKKCNSGKNKKPVVVSMGGAAASGGYYISAYADKIIAQPNTITGSIGVVGALFNFEKLYDKLHINWNTIKKGKNADIGSTNRQMTENEKEMIAKSIKHTYDKFIKVVADGRSIDEAKVREIAQGRVWTGTQALKHKLVDELGGLDRAIELISKEANLTKKAKLITFTGRKKDSVTINLDRNYLYEVIPKSAVKIFENTDKLMEFGDEKVLYLSPSIFYQSSEL